MTLEEFLAWEERQELRWEYDGVGPVPWGDHGPVGMTGGTANHSAIQTNLAISLGSRLRGGPCRFHGPNLRLQVAGSVRYPDGFVVCTPVQGRQTVVDNPVVIFEVLSESTQGTDRTVKAREYMRTPSVARYVMLEQTAAAATVHARDGDRWVVTVLVAGDVLAMPEIGLEVPLAELYEGVDLPPPEADDDEAG